MEMEKIERLAKAYAEARDALEAEARALRDEIEKAKRRRLPKIRQHVSRTSNRAADLVFAVDEGHELFRRPRSRVLHGIRVGLRKRKGRVVIEHSAAVVKLIRKHLPDQFDQLVKVTETPIKSALERLPAADLKRIGVTVEETTDEVFVKPADDEIDKFVDALIGDDELAAEEEAA